LTSHYDVLGVSPQAEDIVIEGAYRALLKRYHPDVHQGDPAVANERAAKINAAYQILRDRDLRERYDQTLAAGPAKAAPRRNRPSSSPPPNGPAASAAPETPTAKASDGGLASLGFLLLAGLVLIGATGSIAQKSGPATATQSPTPASPHPEPPVAKTPSSADSAVVDEAPPEPSPAAFKPSFDCARATSQVLITICESEELSQADVALAESYRAALANSEDPNALREAQRRWIWTRNNGAADYDRLLRLYQDRSAELGSADAIAERLY
jgi:uncharacterized protein YecT (DUF1311 family)